MTENVDRTSNQCTCQQRLIGGPLYNTSGVSSGVRANAQCPVHGFQPSNSSEDWDTQRAFDNPAVKAEIERLQRERDELEQFVADLLNACALPFQDKDEPIPDYAKRCLATLAQRTCKHKFEPDPDPATTIRCSKCGEIG